MLLPFGRFKELARTVTGILLLVIGFTIHGGGGHVVELFGAVLIVWGATRMLYTRHSRDHGSDIHGGRMR